MVLSASGGVLIGLAFAVLGFTTTYNQLAELPSSVPAEQAYSTMAGAFPPGYLGPTQVIVTSDMPKTPLDPAKVDALASSLGHVPGVATVAPARYDASRSAALLNVLLTDDPDSTPPRSTWWRDRCAAPPTVRCPGPPCWSVAPRPSSPTCVRPSARTCRMSCHWPWPSWR